MALRGIVLCGGKRRPSWNRLYDSAYAMFSSDKMIELEICNGELLARGSGMVWGTGAGGPIWGGLRGEGVFVAMAVLSLSLSVSHSHSLTLTLPLSPSPPSQFGVLILYSIIM